MGKKPPILCRSNTHTTDQPRVSHNAVQTLRKVDFANIIFKFFHCTLWNSNCCQHFSDHTKHSRICAAACSPPSPAQTSTEPLHYNQACAYITVRFLALSCF